MNNPGFQEAIGQLRNAAAQPDQQVYAPNYNPQQQSENYGAFNALSPEAQAAQRQQFTQDSPMQQQQKLNATGQSAPGFGAITPGAAQGDVLPQRNPGTPSITPPPGTPGPDMTGNTTQPGSQISGNYIPPQKVSGTNLMSESNEGNNQHGGPYSMEAIWENEANNPWRSTAQRKGQTTPNIKPVLKPGYAMGAPTPRMGPDGQQFGTQPGQPIKWQGPTTPDGKPKPPAPALTPPPGTPPPATTQPVNKFRADEKARQKSLKKNPGSLTY